MELNTRAHNGKYLKGCLFYGLKIEYAKLQCIYCITKALLEINLDHIHDRKHFSVFTSFNLLHHIRNCRFSREQEPIFI